MKKPPSRIELDKRMEILRQKLSKRKKSFSEDFPTKKQLVLLVFLLLSIISLLLLDKCGGAPLQTQQGSNCDAACRCSGSAMARVTSPPKGSAYLERGRQQPRPRLNIADQSENPWLKKFRSLIAKNTLALRKCLPRAPSPGSLRWSLLLVKSANKMTEHRFSGIDGTADPSASEAACLEENLDRIDLKEIEFPQGFDAQRIALILEF